MFDNNKDYTLLKIDSIEHDKEYCYIDLGDGSMSIRVKHLTCFCTKESVHKDTKELQPGDEIYIKMFDSNAPKKLFDFVTEEDILKMLNTRKKLPLSVLIMCN